MSWDAFDPNPRRPHVRLSTTHANLLLARRRYGDGDASSVRVPQRCSAAFLSALVAAQTAPRLTVDAVKRLTDPAIWSGATEQQIVGAIQRVTARYRTPANDAEVAAMAREVAAMAREVADELRDVIWRRPAWPG